MSLALTTYSTDGSDHIFVQRRSLTHHSPEELDKACSWSQACIEKGGGQRWSANDEDILFIKKILRDNRGNAEGSETSGN